MGFGAFTSSSASRVGLEPPVELNDAFDIEGLHGQRHGGGDRQGGLAHEAEVDAARHDEGVRHADDVAAAHGRQAGGGFLEVIELAAILQCRCCNELPASVLVKVADALVRHPGGTLPHKMNDPAALQAMYRLMQRPEVTHATVLAAHQAETLGRIEQHSGPLLAISDATELDYSGLASLEHLGQIGKGNHRGYICHNVLIVDPAQRQAVGLANQILHTRVKAPAGETKKEIRRRESRESRLWPEGTMPLPDDPKLIVVCDRGGDTLEEMEHEAKSRRGFVIRSRHDRKALVGHTGHGAKKKLYTLAREAKAAGRYEVEVAATSQRPGRTATVQFSFRAVRLVPPKQPRGQHSQEPLAVWIVRVWESDPPAATEPLEWFLLTNVPLQRAAAARRVIAWYECRWIVEVYQPDYPSSARLVSTRRLRLRFRPRRCCS